MRSGSDYPHRFTESKGGQYSGYRPYQQNHKKRIYAHDLTSYVDFHLISESARIPLVSIFQMAFHPKRYPSTDGRFCQHRADRPALPVYEPPRAARFFVINVTVVAKQSAQAVVDGAGFPRSCQPSAMAITPRPVLSGN
jgi:hypothetical protein